MSELAKGNHYEQFLNLFRRMKARNALSPFNDDDLIGKNLIIECLKEMEQTMDEQALFEPPKILHYWPRNLKINSDEPDSIFNRDKDNEAWLQIDPIGNGQNTPTTGGTSNTVLHFLADLPKEHDYQYAMVIYADMKSFPPSMRLKNPQTESTSHCDAGNTNQKEGETLTFVRYNHDGTTELISQKQWLASHNADKFFRMNKIVRCERENFLAFTIWQCFKGRVSRSDAILTYQTSQNQDSQANRDSAVQLTHLIKDYQTLASFNNELTATGTNLVIYSPSKSVMGNMVRSTNRLRRLIPKSMEYWTTSELLHNYISEKDIVDLRRNRKIELGELFKSPLVWFTPLRNHRMIPTHSGSKSCKGYQITIMKKNIAETDHYTETWIKPERLGNVSTIGNQLANIGNLHISHGPMTSPRGLNYRFGDYNCYALGTVFDYQQRAVLIQNLFANESRRFGPRMTEVEIPCKDQNGAKSTKMHSLAAPTSHKIFTNNLLSERTYSTLEAMSKLGAIINANVAVNNNIHSVGQLPTLELGMNIEFKVLKNVGILAGKNEGEGQIRDHNGRKRVGIDIHKNHQTAENRVNEIKARKGLEWRSTPLSGNSGLLQAVLQKGPRVNQKKILEEKSNRLDKRIIESNNSDIENSRKRRDIETMTRSEIDQRIKLNPHLEKLEKERLEAFDILKKWMDKDIINVPSWMSNNSEFKKELAGAISPRLYERMLENFGINFVVTAPQAKKLLLQENTHMSTILLVTSAGKIK